MSTTELYNFKYSHEPPYYVRVEFTIYSLTMSLQFFDFFKHGKSSNNIHSINKDKQHSLRELLELFF